VLLAIVLAVITFLVYLPSLNNRFVNWDDTDYVTDNPYLAEGLTWAGVEWSFRSVYASNWHPLTWISHAIDISLYGREAAWGHHLSSVLLHALAAGVLLLALKKLTRQLWPSAVVAALFALHPLHVESVSWVSERKDVLCALFLFLALWAHAWYASAPNWRRYLAVLGAAACALMSKPMAVTLPMVLLVLDFWPLHRLSWRAVAEKVPLLAMAGAVSAATWLAQAGTGSISVMSIMPLGARLAVAEYAYSMYLAKAFWPAPGALIPFYPLAQTGGPLPSPTLMQMTIVGIVAVTVVTFRMRRRRPYLLAGWLIYAGMLVPVCGLFQVGRQIIADRYTYVPLLGVFLAAVWLVQDAVGSRPRWRRPALGIYAVVLATLGWLTWGQQAAWHDSEAMWLRVVAAYPKCGIAWTCLGPVYSGVDPDKDVRARLDLPKAEKCYRTAISLAPDDYQAHSRLGTVLMAAGKDAEAEQEFRRAIEMSPSFPEGHFNYGVFLVKRGRAEEAIVQFRRDLELDPDNVQARKGISVAQQLQQQRTRH
jgi:tetratricopeptide (TPR) repeat protein